MSDERSIGRIDFDPAVGFTTEDAEDLLTGMYDRMASALALHRMLAATGDLPTATLLEYRCAERGCLLARVFPTPAGPAVYTPAFRHSPSRNESTAVAARAKLTNDGDRRWAERADLLDTDPPAGLGVELWLNCDHLLDRPLPSETINADLAARRAWPVLLR